MPQVRFVVVLIVALFALGVVGCAAQRVPTCRVQSRIVESAIAAVARRERGQEYCQFRRYETLSELDGDHVDDVVVLFTIEGLEGGGNDHADFMSVFLSGRSWQPLTVRTGGRGERDPIAIEVREGKLFLNALVYQPTDAMCCPSGKSTLVYEIRGDALVRISEDARSTK